MQGFKEKIWAPFLATRSSLAISFFVIIIIGGFISTRFLDDSSASFIDTSSASKSSLINVTSSSAAPKSSFINVTSSSDPNEDINELKQTQPRLEVPLNCSVSHQTRTCPAGYYPSKFTDQSDIESSSAPAPTCPEYFRYIHNDLWPWRETGISREMVMKAKRTANFRLIIVNGTAYVETYTKSFQSRDTFTLWGILQLLRRYPGKVPDLDLMFDCVDWPVLKTEWFQRHNNSVPPPLFRYCGDDATLDIVFPDWSFWGWPEINLKSWVGLTKDLNEGNERVRWEDREPHAYWKGNPVVAETRMDLMKCNVSDQQDWGARVYAQDWGREHQQGYKESDLASQCVHRYKIYIEGSAWSVSEKYILACDSMTLLVKPHYYDFFTRSLMPLEHYWPIKNDDKCRSIKHAVDWGNSNPEKAKAIGKAASNFIQEQLKVDYVYDYMFHLLSEYAKLLNYKPTVPRKAVELCSESMACPALGFEKQFMEESLVKGPNNATPCTFPPPYPPSTLHSVLEKRDTSTKQVEKWEKEYWKNQKNMQ